MTLAVSQAPAAAGQDESAARRFLRATEIDTRMIGMIAALLLIWFGFHIYGAVRNGTGVFITPRNLWNLLVQTSSIAIMTSGMVLIIVMRHIDLSVGSILGFSAMIIGVLQVYILPQFLGIGHPAIWILTLILGVAFGALIGGFQGALVAYLGIPSFIVTLGGLLVWRGAAWWVATGATVAPMDETFKLMGGGPMGAIGATASWIIGILACGAIIAAILAGRHRRARFKFPLRPVWAEVLLSGLGCAIALSATWMVNAYYWPPKVAERFAAEHNIPVPDGGLLI